MRPRTTNPKFTNFSKFCTKIIAEILSQPEMQNLPLDKHLNMIANHLIAATAAESSSGKKITTAEKLFAFDLANFSAKEKFVPEESDLTLYPQSKIYMPFVCAAAMGNDDFIEGFVWTQNLEISPENLDTYKTRFRESTTQLIEKASRYAMQCSDLHNSSYHNYFREVNHLQSTTEKLSVIDAIKANSYLHQITNPTIVEKAPDGKKRSHSESSEDLAEEKLGAKKYAPTPVNVSDRKTPISDLLDTFSDVSVSPSPKKASPSPQKTKEQTNDDKGDLTQISISFEEERPTTTSVTANSAFQAASKDRNNLFNGGR